MCHVHESRNSMQNIQGKLLLYTQCVLKHTIVCKRSVEDIYSPWSSGSTALDMIDLRAGVTNEPTPCTIPTAESIDRKELIARLLTVNHTKVTRHTQWLHIINAWNNNQTIYVNSPVNTSHVRFARPRKMSIVQVTNTARMTITESLVPLCTRRGNMTIKPSPWTNSLEPRYAPIWRGFHQRGLCSK